MIGPTLGLSDFAREQHQPYSGNSYTISMTEAELVGLVRQNWDAREPGYGEADLSKKVVVPLPAKYVGHFRVPMVDLSPDLPIKARITQRQPGEDFHVETYLDVEDARRLGIQPKVARSVKVVCYSAAALEENNGKRSTEGDWEIVAILASDTDGNEPMRPLTMARNFLEKPGGTKTVYSAQEFAEAVWYWSANKGVRIMRS